MIGLSAAHCQMANGTILPGITEVTIIDVEDHRRMANMIKINEYRTYMWVNNGTRRAYVHIYDIHKSATSLRNADFFPGFI